MSKFITADCNYICGHLRYGHWELNLTDEQFKEFESLSGEEQEQWIKDEGNLIVDDYEIDDHDEPSNINIYDL